MISLSIFDGNAQDETAKRRDLYLTRLRELSSFSELDNYAFVQSSETMPAEHSNGTSSGSPAVELQEAAPQTQEQTAAEPCEPVMAEMGETSTELSVDQAGDVAVAVEEEPPVDEALDCAPPDIIDKDFDVAEEPPAPVNIEPDPSNQTDAFQRLAEEITPKLVGALTSAIRQVHDATTSHDGRLDAAVSGLSAISISVDHLTDEVASLKEAGRTFTFKLSRMEDHLGENDQGSVFLAGELERLKAGSSATATALEEKLRQVEQRLTAISDFSHLNDRLDRLDRSLQVQSETTVELRTAYSRLQEGQHAAQNRMDLQAEAIRTLHACTGLGSRRGEFQDALQKLQEILNDASKPESLPENL